MQQAREVFASVFGSIRGIVHDPQHRPVENAMVMLRSKTSDWTASATTDASGQFIFTSVSLGDYTVTVAVPTFNQAAQDVRVSSGSQPVLHFSLNVATNKQIVNVSGAPVQVFGVVFARDTRGLTYDSIGLNGASTTVMSRAFNPQTFSAALEHRNPDLVVINYGTNESGYPAYVEKQYEPELIRAIGRVRAALPNASILIMSPMDRGERSGDQITTMRAMLRNRTHSGTHRRAHVEASQHTRPGQRPSHAASHRGQRRRNCERTYFHRYRSAGVRTSTLRTPARSMRAWMGASRLLSTSVA